MRHLLLTASLLLIASPAFADDEDIGTGSSPICCGANCCLIAGTCFSRGETNPDNECEACDPSSTQTAFTAVPGCTPADSGVAPADSGVEPADSGVTPTEDSGVGPAVDSGTSTPADSGTSTPMDSGTSSGGDDAGTTGGGDGGCSVGAGQAAAPGALMFLAMLGLLWRRRA